MFSQLCKKWFAAAAVAAVGACAAFFMVPAGTATAGATSGSVAGETILVSELPREAVTTLKAIRRGGPYDYKKDGTVFGNYERLLPRQKRGYYTEYTVKTPGARNRGARRIIAGKGATGNPATSGEYWYTADHYNSFKRIVDR